jgi:hypothetical protein
LWGRDVTALLILTATTAQALIVPSMAECMMAAQYFLPFARVWCVPAGVAL